MLLEKLFVIFSICGCAHGIFLTPKNNKHEENVSQFLKNLMAHLNAQDSSTRDVVLLKLSVKTKS